MKRFLIFGILFPPLGLLIAIAAIPDARNHSSIGFMFWMLGIAYVVGLIPALLSAVVDRALSASELYVRLTGTALAGAISIIGAVAAFNFSEMLVAPIVLLIALMGAAPAAVCCWVADKAMTAKS